MKTFLRISLFLLICFGAILMVRHGDMSLSPVCPPDMPAQASFLQSGYDVSRLEPRGNWVACGTDHQEQTNWCRVTDAHGDVVYEGDYLPVSGRVPVPTERIELSRSDPDKLWVKGPAEGGPVPVIPLSSGEVLVPAADRDALATRWAQNPSELQALSAQ